MSPTEPQTQQTMPPEWLEELNQYHPKSFEYEQTLKILRELATEAGLSDEAIDLRDGSDVIDLRDIPDTVADVPAGYSSIEYLFDYHATIGTEQFKGVIQPQALATTEDTLDVEVTELVTDAGKKVRLVDLRPYMSNSIRKKGPSEKVDIEKLEETIFTEIKMLAETGRAPNVVRAAPKVGYSKLGHSKVRGYWMPIKDDNNPDHVLTVARLADCGNSVADEQDLYRALFGAVLKK